jgi:hypothetical protein
MGAGIEEGTDDRGVGAGRRADADEIDLAQKVAPVCDGGDVEVALDVMACFAAGIGYGAKLDAREAEVLRRVMATENAGANNGGSEDTLGRKRLNVQKA